MEANSQIDLLLFISIGTLFISAFTIALLLPKARTKYFWAIVFLFALNTRIALLLSIKAGVKLPFLLANPAWVLLFPPALYFYTRSILSAKKIPTKLILLQLTPFFLFFGLTLFYPPVAPQEMPQFKAEMTHPPMLRMIMGEAIRWSFAFISIIYYIAIWRLLNRHQQQHHEYFAHEDAFNTFQWMRWIVVIAVLAFGVQFFFMLYNDPRIHLTLGSLPQWTNALARLTMTSVFAYFISRQPILISNSNLSPTTLSTAASAKTVLLKVIESPAQSIVQDESIRQLIDKLEQRMMLQKDYLQPKIKIADVAEVIDVPSHQLSKAINEHYGYNFFHFINKYRVEHAKELLQQLRMQQITIDGIGMESGFNSRATFYKRFKEYTGITPREFMKQQIEREIS